MPAAAKAPQREASTRHDHLRTAWNRGTPVKTGNQAITHLLGTAAPPQIEPGDAVPDSVYDAVQTGGTRLDAHTRAEMEQVVGQDLSRVRVHDGPLADASAQAIRAQAYTVGPDVVFAAGRYQPSTSEGKQLLAHELTHVAQVGARRPIGPLRLGQTNDRWEAEAGGFGERSAGGAQAEVVRRSPAGTTPTSPAPAAQMREYVNESGERVRVTEAEYADKVREAQRRLADSLRRVKDKAEVYRDTHANFMKNVHGEANSVWDVVKSPSTAVAIAVDIRSGVTPPPVGMWHHALHAVELGQTALASSNTREAASDLRLASNSLRDSVAAWNLYMDQIQHGGEKLVGELEVVRDVSFAIAITAAVIVAAPVVAGAAATGTTALGVSGVAATGLSTVGTAVGTGAVGAAFGGGLRGTSDALAQKTVNGRVDWTKTKKEGVRGAKEGFVSGVTAGTTAGLGSAVGVGAKGLSTTSQIGRKVVVEGGANLVGGSTSAALEGKSAKEIATAGVTGFATGAIAAPLGSASSKLVGGGRPALAKAVDVGGSMAVGGGVALASGADRDEAMKQALIAGTSTLALSGASHGQKGNAAPHEDAPAGVKDPTAPENAGVKPAAATTEPATPVAAPAEAAPAVPAAAEHAAPAAPAAAEPAAPAVPAAAEPATPAVPAAAATPATATVAPETAVAPAAQTAHPDPPMYGPVREIDEVFGGLKQELANEPAAAAKPPVEAAAPAAAKPPSTPKTEAQRQQEQAALRQEAARVVTEKLDANFPPGTPARAAIEGNPTLSKIAADSPSLMHEYWTGFQAKTGSSATPSEFAAYVRSRQSSEARPQLGETTQAFARGADGEHVIAAPGDPNAPGIDLITYAPKDDRIKLVDDKSYKRNVGKVSALEKNLPPNIRDVVNDLHTAVQEPNVPNEIRTKVMPRLAAATRDLERYVAANPAADLRSAAVQRDFQRILQNHGIDRVVTNTAGSQNAGITSGLASRGFIFE
ncbi:MULTISPECIES: DUF4157 domain-containing protein [unclassified Mycobacterium]|uniref:eCIS core domain-containing protein n=1 Tax=unclassified Mycobacterium TaxID=2642494 RepID=UPI0015A4DAA2|nr:MULTISPECIES: DUF4157 domain-containing protein [unclassified Mycobacterium]